MTKFCDLHLLVPLADLEQARKLISKSAELGYSQIGVPSPLSAKKESVHHHLLQNICREFGLDLATRVDLVPRSVNELLGSLRRFRRRFELVSVLCRSKVLARQAAKDRRVDLLCFAGVEARRSFFDRGEAELASKSGAALEVDLAQVLSVDDFSTPGFLTRLRRDTALAKRFGVPVVLSSGASDALFLRKPQDLAAMAFLFDMDSESALNALSTNPLGIVERNRAKLSPSYVAKGVRLVREGLNR